MLVEWIRTEMDARGLKQKDVADAVGWTEVQASKVMHKGRRIQADEIFKIMDLFGYPTPYNAAKNPDMHMVMRSLSSIDESQRAALVEYILKVAER